MRAENQRVANESTAPSTARPATAPATHSTTVMSLGRMPSSMMVCSSSGTATAITADSVVSVRKMARSRRYGRAYDAIRRTMPRLSRCWVTDLSRVNERIACH